MSSPVSESSGRTARHVCLVIKDLDIGKGGAERLYVELAAILHELGYRVTCLYYGSNLRREDVLLGRVATVRNLATNAARQLSPLLKSRKFRAMALQFLRVGYLHPATAHAIWQWTHGRFTRALADFFNRERPDVAISFLPPANTPTLIAAQGTRVKVICTNHNVPAADYDDPSRWDPNPHDRRLRLKMLDSAAAIHLLQDSFTTWFPAHLQGRLVVVPNYVSPEIRNVSGRPAREKLVLAAGRLAKVKSYSTLVQAWARIAARFPDWRVEIYGDGPLRGRLLDEVRRLGVEKSFYIAGYTSNIAEAYSRAAIFCHPALFEGFGLSVAEALALGVPVVAFKDCAGVNTFAIDGYNAIMVDREDAASSLAAGLSRLMENEELRQRLAANGPESVDRYTVEAYAQRWSNILSTVLDQ